MADFLGGKAVISRILFKHSVSGNLKILMPLRFGTQLFWDDYACKWQLKNPSRVISRVMSCKTSFREHEGIDSGCVHFAVARHLIQKKGQSQKRVVWKNVGRLLQSAYISLPSVSCLFFFKLKEKKWTIACLAPSRSKITAKGGARAGTEWPCGRLSQRLGELIRHLSPRDTIRASWQRTQALRRSSVVKKIEGCTRANAFFDCWGKCEGLTDVYCFLASLVKNVTLIPEQILNRCHELEIPSTNS